MSYEVTFGCDHCKKACTSDREFSYLTIKEKRTRLCTECRHEYARKMENSRKHPDCTKCKDEFYACEPCMKKAREQLLWNPSIDFLVGIDKLSQEYKAKQQIWG